VLVLHQSQVSGNCYKVRLALAQLGIPYRVVELDLARGDAKTPEFRAQHPLGRVPVVHLDDGTVLAESNAILWYFASESQLVPTDRLARAQVLQWMFWEQYSHEPYIAVVRAWKAFFGIPAGKEAELVERTQKGYAALDVMERALTTRPFFVADRYTIADIALYAYTHVAHEGDFDLTRYKSIRAWMERVSQEPGHVAIAQRPV
jgi:glutathione S-transferase